MARLSAYNTCYMVIMLGFTAVQVAGSAHASVSGFYGTGVDIVGGVDQAWSLIPGGSTGTPIVSGRAYPFEPSSTSVFPYGHWLVPSTGYWDTPDRGNTLVNTNRDPSVIGVYEWQTTFSSTGTGPLTLDFAADDAISSIALNGDTVWMSDHCLTGNSCPNDFSSLLTATITGGFASGTNTLDFFVVNYAQNGGNPTGLYVASVSEAASSSPIASVPELRSWAMTLLGFAGLGFAGYCSSCKAVSTAS